MGELEHLFVSEYILKPVRHLEERDQLLVHNYLGIKDKEKMQ